jgi:hypothetical protein
MKDAQNLRAATAHFGELLIRQFEGAAILLLDKRKHFRSLALPLARPAPYTVENGIELFVDHGAIITSLALHVSQRVSAGW